MNPNYLDFEQPIADLEAKILELGRASTGQSVNIDAEVDGLREKQWQELLAMQKEQLALLASLAGPTLLAEGRQRSSAG